MISKGTVSAIYSGGDAVTVKPYLGEVVTTQLVVPFFLTGCLEVGMPVAYATFEDNTGVVLCRMDGEWNHELEGDISVKGDISTSSVASYNGHTHTVTGSSTGTPR